MDISLYYQEKGQGIPLVLLHGNGESGDYFKNQIEYFSNQYRVIAVDTRGHGKSPRGTAPFTMDQFAEDLNAFLESLNLTNIILLGFSDGANIAIKFALKYQDKIKALILNGADLNTKGVKRTVQIPIEISYRFAKMFAHKSENAKKKAEILGLMVNEPNIKAEFLHSIKVPTLVIAGKQDLIKDSHTKLIAENIKDSELSIIEGNHFIAGRHPNEFNKEVEKFLNKVLNNKKMEVIMEEFNTIEKVQELFASINALGENNTFFVACQDKQKVSGMVAGMEYPYDGLLINDNENGITMFYLKAGALSGLITLANPSKMKLDKENYVHIPTDNIKDIKIKNFALLNSKTKRIEINTLDGKSHKLYAKVDEKDFPYHKENFAKFMEKYSK